jgi:copper(I)-binding protein
MIPGIRSMFVAVALTLPFALPASAQSVTVKEAWIRGTVPGQSGTGAFMELTGKTAARLVGASSSAAKIVEVHSMKMENGVMKMSAVDGVDLPPGKPVRLAPGGYHVMLMELHKPLSAGERVPLRLSFEFPDKRRETLDLSVEVRDVKGQPAKSAQGGYHGH